MSKKSIRTFAPTTKDLFANRIAREIFNYPNDYGILTFTVKFNYGNASCLTINKEEKISLNSLSDRIDAQPQREGEL